jgi:hypothetical protein
LPVWAINGTQSTGSGRTYGAKETYGILNTFWNGSALAALTSRLQVLMNTGANLASGIYKIINVNSGLTMEVYNWGTANGDAIDQWSYLSGANRKWNLLY